MSPLVSILIPVYNAERWIAQAIESALAQTWREKEVIIVDDGSTDRSLDIIRRFDARIRWETGPNRGGNAARNRLLELARGEWLQYLDADDWLRPEKITHQVEFLSRHPACDVVCSPTLDQKTENGDLVPVNADTPFPVDPWILLAHWRLPQTGGPLWRRAALDRVGGWREGQPCCQEHELYFRLLEAGCRFEFYDSSLAIYRNWEHGSRVTGRLGSEIDRQRLKILDRISRCLAGRGTLTAARRRAVSDARHEVARKAWSRDRRLALDVIRQVKASDPGFCPSEGPSSPQAYRFIYRMVGFEASQWIAKGKRGISSALSSGLV